MRRHLDWVCLCVCVCVGGERLCGWEGASETERSARTCSNIHFCVASGIFTAAWFPQDFLGRRSRDVLAALCLPSSLAAGLELIEEPEDWGLTDRPLRLVASLLGFVCSVLLTRRGSLPACFPCAASSAPSVRLSPACSKRGGGGGRGQGPRTELRGEALSELSGCCTSAVGSEGPPRHRRFASCVNRPPCKRLGLFLLLLQLLLLLLSSSSSAPTHGWAGGGALVVLLRSCCCGLAATSWLVVLERSFLGLERERGASASPSPPSRLAPPELGAPPGISLRAPYPPTSWGQRGGSTPPRRSASGDEPHGPGASGLPQPWPGGSEWLASAWALACFALWKTWEALWAEWALVPECVFV